MHLLGTISSGGLIPIGNYNVRVRGNGECKYVIIFGFGLSRAKICFINHN